MQETAIQSFKSTKNLMSFGLRPKVYIEKNTGKKFIGWSRKENQ